ncbi:hypothetical protein FAGAP_5570 [Fusarium agapanthi]|uniref:Beta-glucuronidase C-terminal domain-containing protein n=1 Tax=Fusarium agapanthi TaxID=1803897 RepID=A0A9P5BAQ0_9HYPO|nr:hypothetical protein FAGAP_5570 [Fusarium agapanthi]
MDDEQSEGPTFSFSDIYHELLSAINPDDDISPCLRSVKAPLDVRVVLECVHALVRENRETRSSKSIVKIPALPDVKYSLVQIFHLINDTWSFDKNERLELIIAWHFVCLDMVCDWIELFDQICRHLQIDQHIFNSRDSEKELKDSVQWFRGSTDARCAFLHAVAIQDSVNQLPFNCTNTFWMPIPIFAASGMFSFSRLSGMTSVSVPASIHWESTLVDQSNVGEAVQQDISWKKTQAFMLSNIKTTNCGIGPARNLPFEMKKMQTLMHGLASQWGIAVEMSVALASTTGLTQWFAFFCSQALAWVVLLWLPKYAVPDAQPKNAVAIDPAPVGASFEFFMWPSYMTNISLTLPCIDHFNKLYSRKMPIRIGGTTQYRATYDPALKGYVSYSVNNPLEAPMSLTYGPKFFDLIKKFGSESILGFNRGLNNRTNTFAAVLKAKEKVAKNLWAIELGNEPDYVVNHWKSPLPMLAGGGYAIPFEIEPDWPNLPYLIGNSYNKTVKDATKVYNGHFYAFSNATADDLGPEMKYHAKTAGRPYILGEKGFHRLDYEMDSTFGSAIQTTDKTLRVDHAQTFLTEPEAFFNWWWSDHVNAPFYGAYFGALAVAGAFKVALINTDYYSGGGTRSEAKFTLTGLRSNSVKALRMTGLSSETTVPVTQTKSSPQPSIRGQSFSNKNCELGGKQNTEKLSVKKGKLEITLKASEALIVYL